MTQEKITNDNGLEVYKGKWGYYPCNYKTFLKLKEINKHYEKSKRDAKTWYRWARKIKSNRKGVKPEVSSVFCELVSADSVKYKYSEKSGPFRKLVDEKGYTYVPVGIYEYPKDHKYWMERIGWNHPQQIVVRDHGIVKAYKNARTPKKEASWVRQMPLPEGMIDAMMRDLGLDPDNM